MRRKDQQLLQQLLYPMTLKFPVYKITINYNVEEIVRLSPKGEHLITVDMWRWYDIWPSNMLFNVLAVTIDHLASLIIYYYLY